MNVVVQKQRGAGGGTSAPELLVRAGWRRPCLYNVAT